MMTNEERIEALKWLGYSEQEAAFLCLAALHSGYFVRRQYNAFAVRSRGRGDDALVRKVLAREHGRGLNLSKKTITYHLCSRPFYAAIGQADNRHRRERAPFAIKAKLMALDYVLANPGYRYLATEEEKLTYFAGELGLEISRLPAKVYRSRSGNSTAKRYFVDKFPIFIPKEPSPRATPVVSFCYIDEGVIATPGFDTYLKQYANLFQSLGRFRIVYVATEDRYFRSAEQVFRRFVHHSHQGKTTPSMARLLEYFQLEHLFRTRQFDELDIRKIERLRVLRKELQSRYDSLFELWKERGEQAVCDSLSRGDVGPGPLDCDFLACRLDHDYSLFGAE